MTAMHEILKANRFLFNVNINFILISFENCQLIIYEGKVVEGYPKLKIEEFVSLHHTCPEPCCFAPVRQLV